MKHAVIVAHGQPSDPDPAEAALADFASHVDALADQISVTSATLAAPGMLEHRLGDLPAGTAIYPLFMAKGWFVTSALPRRIGDRDAPILDPLGIDPELPALVARALQATLADHAWKAEETDLVIAAHGSGRSANPATVTARFADALSGILGFKSMRLGFVEQPPSIADAASAAGNQSICLPFFACTGGHVLEDVPQDLARANFAGLVMPVVGELPGIHQHIATVLTRAVSD